MGPVLELFNHMPDYFCLGFVFGPVFEQHSGPEMVPKVVHKLTKADSLLGPLFYEICPPLFSPELVKISKDGLRKQSKRAKIAGTNDFENMIVYMCF